MQGEWHKHIPRMLSNIYNLTDLNYHIIIYLCMRVFYFLSGSQPQARFHVLEDHQPFAHMLDVTDLIMSLSAGSPECEQGFSQLKITKSQYRNKLKSTTLTMLMTIQLYSGNVAEVYANQAIHQRNLHHNRRPIIMETYSQRTMPETQAVE